MAEEAEENEDLPIQPVVNVVTGEIWTPALLRRAYFGVQAYRPDDLKKNGEPKAYARAPEVLDTEEKPNVWRNAVAFYLPDREAQAEPIRARIAELEKEVQQQKGQLAKLYGATGTW